MVAESHADALADAQRLIAARDKLQTQLEARTAALAAQSHDAGLTGTLVDAEGFPRADIDVYNIRMQRVELLRLRNDLTQLTNDIERALHRVHSTARAERTSGTIQPPGACSPPAAAAAATMSAITSSSTTTSGNGSTSGNEHNTTATTPLAAIDGVAPDSPAHDAGLQRRDRIIAFGNISQASIKRGGPSALELIAAEVRHSEDLSLTVVVHRDGEPNLVRLTLVPHKWAGRGLLGCHIVPV